MAPNSGIYLKPQQEKMMNKQLLSLYGLKYNPFTTAIPTEALHVYPELENLLWRIENNFVREGGFALLSGDPGTGKSAALRLLEEKLSNLRDIKVGVITHASARLADFYRELGDIFEVPLRAHNRWNSFKNLRERWRNHLETTLIRPLLFIDEAQGADHCLFNELRLLTSAEFDSRQLMSIVMAGDKRLNDKLRSDELLPLGSRIRVRLNLDYSSISQLKESLQYLVDASGNPNLMTSQLIQTLCEHSTGNYRVLCNMANTLLITGMQKEKSQLDEQLYFYCFDTNSNKR